ncbi:MAG: TIM barrel protein [Planctomycetota bacterium]
MAEPARDDNRPTPKPARRRFLQATAAAAGLVIPGRAVGEAGTARSAAAGSPPPANSEVRRGALKRSVKWGMIQIDGPALERFCVCRDLGYDGMELISPVSVPLAELRAASQETGLPIHGLVNDKHWQVRLSSPDGATRERAVGILDAALRDAAAMGGHAVLLVPGVVGDEATHAEVWSRSMAGIRQVLPTAAALGVRVLIENVWNGFCETPEQLRDYLDEIDGPWVGAYFDIGNAQKFAPPAAWIRTLGRRIVKLDVKDWGAANGFCKIGDGDVDWSAVREALGEIGYSGWCTAEVTGGGRDRLADIAERMDTVLGV